MPLHRLIASLCTGVAMLAHAAEPVPTELAADTGKMVPLYAGTAPGSEAWNWEERVSSAPWGGAGGRLVRNVRQPTLTVFAPPNPLRAARTAVIVAPGGGFQWLSIDGEGIDVARALAAQGITALVLKYRLHRTEDAEPAFRQQALAFIDALGQRGPGDTQDPIVALAVDDGIAAVRYVRAHAAALAVDPQRIGIVGFSAGGVVALGTLHGVDKAGMPNFAGIVYAPRGADEAWKPGTPPVFVAAAADDALAGDGPLDLYRSLRAAGVPAELHLYQSGGHGFGMQQRGLTTDLWLSQFTAWMAARGLLPGR